MNFKLVCIMNRGDHIKVLTRGFRTQACIRFSNYKITSGVTCLMPLLDRCVNEGVVVTIDVVW